MHYVKYQLKLMFKSRLFLFALLLCFICFAAGILSTLINIEMDRGLSIFFIGFHLGKAAILPVIAPLIAALPMADSYLNDEEYHMINTILIRESKRKYFVQKFITVGASGFIILVLPSLILLFVNIIIYRDINNVDTMYTQPFFLNLFNKSELICAIILILNSGLVGFIYANIGLVSSFFIKNKYICIFFPFLVYYLPSFIFPFLGLDRFEPITTFDFARNADTSFFTVYGELFFLLIVTFSIGYIKMTKKERSS